jgi:hypothetical protein
LQLIKASVAAYNVIPAGAHSKRTKSHAPLNDNRVPQLFVASGANEWNDPKSHPWTMGWRPSYRVEARISGGTGSRPAPSARSP